MKRILIVNAAIVNEGEIRTGDVFIRNGRIENIDADLASKPADVVVDARGRHLLPGLIDDQVHFREPGLTHKGDIFSEARAAVAGGITSFMEMPNTQPPTLTRALLEEKYRIAERTSLANYAFYLGASNDNIEEIKALDPKQACGIKVFMGASTGNMLVDDPRTLESIFAHAPTLVATHCEDTPTIAANEKRYRARFGRQVPMEAHPAIRSTDACLKSSSLAVELAARHGTQLHVLHLTTAAEMALFSPGEMAQKHVTAEVCVHHLFFSADDYPGLGSRIKCNPAIKTPADRRALIQAVKTGKIDVIATDHAPHTLAEKQNPYFDAPSGLPLVQHALLSLLEHYHRGEFPLELIVEKTSHAPATRFEIQDRGFIREGYWADLVLVDIHRDNTVTPQNILYRCGWSPYEGRTFKSSVDTVIVSGHLAYHRGRLYEDTQGKRLMFNR